MPRLCGDLVAALHEEGYTCQAAAKELLITYQTFSEKVNGKYPWTLDEVYKLLELIKCSPAAMHHYFPDRRRRTA